MLASGNHGKLAEFAELLAPCGIQLFPQAEFGIEPPAEDGASFVANALLKARFAAAGSGLAALADDSGLEVDALDGSPGVYSARYAGPGASDAANLRKLLTELAGTPLPTPARFCCVIALVRRADDPAPLLAHGVWEGAIISAARGTAGFGYDPVFLDPQSGLTAAELSLPQKNARSHRGVALRALLAQLSA